MSEEELVRLTRAMERCDPPAGGFHHIDHLRLAWVYLHEAPTVDDAFQRMAKTLKDFSRSVGKLEKYSDSLTAFWIYQLAALAALTGATSLDDLLRECPRLLDKNFGAPDFT